MRGRGEGGRDGENDSIILATTNKTAQARNQQGEQNQLGPTPAKADEPKDELKLVIKQKHNHIYPF